jgi:hypothetical protein
MINTEEPKQAADLLGALIKLAPLILKEVKQEMGIEGITTKDYPEALDRAMRKFGEIMYET